MSPTLASQTETAIRVRPFGLTKAVPVVPENAPLPRLSLCPNRQVAVLEDGTPFIHEPSMKSKFKTKVQTREDSNLDTETENDED
ncbi:putative ATP-grasp-modified RiPP [Streptomyces sp. NPDC037389]|uniref:putative ATP-grasp-modified RiPP n=1 Tax=Streptomyces sp. NPDC037389 TaxID=3155369 RepID=UPI0033F5A523